MSARHSDAASRSPRRQMFAHSGTQHERLLRVPVDDHLAAAKASMSSPVLSARRWWVLIDAMTMYEKSGPLPDFPADPDAAMITELADAGLILARRDARIEAWQSRFDGVRVSTPQIRGLAQRLEPDFAQLEADAK